MRCAAMTITMLNSFEMYAGDISSVRVTVGNVRELGYVLSFPTKIGMGKPVTGGYTKLSTVKSLCFHSGCLLLGVVDQKGSMKTNS